MRERSFYALALALVFVASSVEGVLMEIYDPVSRVINALQLGIGSDEREYSVGLRGSSFRVDARVGKVTVNMMVDTGSAVVMLSKSTAREVGYRVDQLRFDTEFVGIAGRTHAAMVLLPPIRVGSIVVEDLSGYVADDTSTINNLLGIPFLTQLKRLEISDKRLRLVQ
jgi:clan AA aspartic protease (TIGR02281 family)